MMAKKNFFTNIYWGSDQLYPFSNIREIIHTNQKYKTRALYFIHDGNNCNSIDNNNYIAVRARFYQYITLFFYLTSTNKYSRIPCENLSNTKQIDFFVYFRNDDNNRINRNSEVFELAVINKSKTIYDTSRIFLYPTFNMRDKIQYYKYLEKNSIKNFYANDYYKYPKYSTNFENFYKHIKSMIHDTDDNTLFFLIKDTTGSGGGGITPFKMVRLINDDILIYDIAEQHKEEIMSYTYDQFINKYKNLIDPRNHYQLYIKPKAISGNIFNFLKTKIKKAIHMFGNEWYKLHPYYQKSDMNAEISKFINIDDTRDNYMGECYLTKWRAVYVPYMKISNGVTNGILLHKKYDVEIIYGTEKAQNYLAVCNPDNNYKYDIMKYTRKNQIISNMTAGRTQTLNKYFEILFYIHKNDFKSKLSDNSKLFNGPHEEFDSVFSYVSKELGENVMNKINETNQKISQDLLNSFDLNKEYKNKIIGDKIIYSIFAYDFIVDRKNSVYVLEINDSPVVQNNTEDFIDGLVEASFNDMKSNKFFNIKSDIKGGHFYEKYVKYKNKYLQLKKQ